MKTYSIAFLIAIMALANSAYAADLTINSMADITNNCPYNTDSKTYSCTGWGNIYVQNDISLPVVGCYASGSDIYGCTATKIVFNAENEFSAKNIYATNYGGNGGSITITSKKITASSLNTYGAGCGGNCNYQNGYSCSSSNGGPITLKGEMIAVGTINANDGAGGSGGGGTITLTANTITVTDIYSNGAGYQCSYDYGGDDGPGSGGSVIAKAKTANINAIYIDGGGSSNYCGYGGSGGSLKLVADDLTLNSISANGLYRGGSGGNIKIFTDKYSLNSVTANGGAGGTSSSCGGRAPGNGGVVRIFSDSKSTTSTTFSLSAGPPYTYCSGCCSCTTPSYATSYGVEGILNYYPRTGSGFFGFQTNLPLAYKSYSLSIKDALSGTPVQTKYGTNYSLDGSLSSGLIKTFIGRVTPIKLKLGNDYLLRINGSNESVFNGANCGVKAACKDYDIPFAEY